MKLEVSFGGKGIVYDRLSVNQKKPEGPTPFWQVCFTAFNIQVEYLISLEHKFYGFDYTACVESSIDCQMHLIVHCEFTD